MYDTFKAELYKCDVRHHWRVDDIKANLMPADKYIRGNFKPTGMIRNMAVFVTEDKIKIDGSIAKYLNKNNIENFDFRLFRFAIMKLSEELGVDMSNARIRRLDIGANFELKDKVSNYFSALFYLRYYQRDFSRKTTLRFYANSSKNNLLFYDKIMEFASKNKKLIKDDSSYIDTFENLMRYESMIQSRPSKILGIPDLRISDLFEPENSKKALRYWYDMYFKIEKKAVLDYPKQLKTLYGFEKFMKRYIIQTMGWERLKFLLKQGVEKKCFSDSSASKKLDDFEEAMSDDFNFEFQDNIKELNHKIKVMYVEGLKQIFRME